MMAAVEVVVVDSWFEVLEVISAYENRTSSHFVVKNSRGEFQANILHAEQKVLWNLQSRSDRGFTVPFDGIPFIFLADRTMMCHHGPDKGQSTKRKWKEKREMLQANGNVTIKQHFQTQPTKKLDCPVVLSIKKLATFPLFKISCIEMKRMAAMRLKEALHAAESTANWENEDLGMVIRYYIQLPDVSTHENHVVGAIGGFSEPVDIKIRDKVMDLVSQGVRKTQQIQQCIQDFVENDLFRDETPPDRNRRRYYPHAKDLANMVTKAKLATRYSPTDQENVALLVAKLQAEGKNVFFTPSTTELQEVECLFDAVENEVEIATETLATMSSDQQDLAPPVAAVANGNGKQLLFVYQSAEMKRLYEMYARTTVILDSTYRTSKYALPLLMMVVRTNVDNQVVALFVVRQETVENISAALEVIKEWNPEIIPQFAMVDVSEVEIRALEEAFPGISVFIGEFQREQAWNKWLSKVDNGLGESVDEVKIKLRRIANACNDQTLAQAITDFEKSPVYSSNAKLRSWFEIKWKPHIKRWSMANYPQDISLSVKSNKGADRQDEELKFGYFDGYRHCSLTELIDFVVRRFLPDRFRKYVELNVRYSSLYRKYNETVPDFMKDRPREIVDDMRKKMAAARSIPGNSIHMLRDGVFWVPSETDSSSVYTLCFGDDMTCCSCTCPSFQRQKLLCKHFFAIFQAFPDWPWQKVSSVYTTNPLLMLDNDIVSGTVRESLNFYPNLTDDTELTEVIDGIDELTDDGGNDGVNGSGVHSSQSSDSLVNQSSIRREQEMTRSVLRSLTDLSYRVKDVKSLQSLRSKLETIQMEIRHLSSRENGSILADAGNRSVAIKREMGYTDGSIGIKRSKPLFPFTQKVADGLAKKAKMKSRSWQKKNNLKLQHVKSGLSSAEDDEDDDEAMICDDMKMEMRNNEIDNTYWLKNLFLMPEDRQVLISRQHLTDSHIEAASMLLRKQFPHVEGLENSLLTHSPEGFTRRMSNKLNVIQIHQIAADHFITSSRHAGCYEVFVYDSLRPHCSSENIAPDIMLQLKQIYANEDSDIFVTCPPITRHVNAEDCGVFAIATATDICFGLNPSLKCYDIKLMRKHLENCYVLGNMQPFPVVTLC